MLHFNPRRMMSLRGIDKRFNFLSKNGFGRSAAHQIANSTSLSVKVEHISKLCVLLNCTPNDLFEWHRDTKTVLPEDHALQTLVKEGAGEKNLKELLLKLPPDKLAELEGLLEGSADG